MSESIEKQLEISQRRHESLRIILTRRGLLDSDPNTPEGKLINEMLDEFTASGDPRLPPVFRAALAEIIVSGIVMSRSAMTHLITARAPSLSPSEAGKAKRQALQIAVSTYTKSSAMIMNALKILHGGDPASAKGKLAEILADIVNDDKEKKEKDAQGAGN